MNIIEKIKNLSLSSKILLVLAVLFLYGQLKDFGSSNIGVSNYSDGMPMTSVSPMYSKMSTQESFSNSGSSERQITTNSYFSLLVKNVTDSVEAIKNQAVITGGFYINANVTRNDNNEEATLSIRIPSEKVEGFKDYLRKNSIKVVSENVVGTDITDQYTDFETRLYQLNVMKTKLNDLMAKATTVEEMMNIQNQIFNIQDQIDSIKGQISYMDKSVSTSQITINLATDELGLPYTPQNAWRPEAIFKQAVRSFFGVLQGIGTLAIWALVFSPFVAIIFAIIKIWKSFKKRKA